MHFKRDYKEEKMKNKKEKRDLDDDLEIFSQEDGGDSFFEALTTHVGHSAWFIGYGAPFHMNSHWHWFSVYEKYDDGMVYLGDHSPLNIVSHGTALIRFFDVIVKGISGVLHIPSLAQNLISISTLNDASVRVVFSDKGCNMVRESMVLTKGVCVGNFFHHDVCTIQCNSYLISTVEISIGSTPSQ
jgi:hypothetical protein